MIRNSTLELVAKLGDEELKTIFVIALEHDISLRELAALMGYSHAYLYQVLKGRLKITGPAKENLNVLLRKKEEYNDTEFKYYVETYVKKAVIPTTKPAKVNWFAETFKDKIAAEQSEGA